MSAEQSVYLYSSLPTPQVYPIYEEMLPGRNVRVIKKDLQGNDIQMEVAGGHGVAIKGRGTGAIHTPRGVVTQVPKKLFDEVLEKNPELQRVMDAGFISVQSKKVAPEKVVKDMPESKDSPMTENNVDDKIPKGPKR